MTLEETLQDFIISTRRMSEETDRKFQETDRMFQETARRFQETDRKFQETDHKFQETDHKFQETDRKFQETDRKIDKVQGLFTTQWGKLVEAMVEPAALALFRERGIEVVETMRRVVVKRPGLEKEFDVILVNGDVVVVVEVKTTLRVADIREHVKCLEHLTDYLPEHRGKRILGAMAYISADRNTDAYARKRGLYVIALTGENLLCIRNPPDFQPRDFSAQPGQPVRR